MNSTLLKPIHSIPIALLIISILESALLLDHIWALELPLPALSKFNAFKILSAAAAVLLIIYLRPSTKHEITNKNETELKEQLGKISLNLLQTNLKVSSHHIFASTLTENTKSIHPQPNIPEIRLRSLDEALKTKETIASIDNVIKSRQLIVSESIKEIQQLSKRRISAATAAAGGFASAFITYQVGQSIKNFWLLRNNQHTIDINYWLTGTVQHFADPTKLGEIHGSLPSYKKDQDKETFNSEKNNLSVFSIHNSGDSTKSRELYKLPLLCNTDKAESNGTEGVKDLLVSSNRICQASAYSKIQCPENAENRCALANEPSWAGRSEQLDLYLDTQFRQPEMLAEAWLLTATLIVSVAAAIFGWNKPQSSSDS